MSQGQARSSEDARYKMFLFSPIFVSSANYPPTTYVAMGYSRFIPTSNITVVLRP